MGLLIGQEKFKRKKVNLPLDTAPKTSSPKMSQKPKTNSIMDGAQTGLPVRKKADSPKGDLPKSQSGSYVRKSIIGPYPLRASFFKRKEVTDRFEY